MMPMHLGGNSDFEMDSNYEPEKFKADAGRSRNISDPGKYFRLSSPALSCKDQEKWI